MFLGTHQVRMASPQTQSSSKNKGFINRQTTESFDSESFAALFEESLNRQEMKQGEVITAEVIRVDYNFVVVNAGLKSEAYIPLEEFKNDNGELDVKPGDFVSVAIESLENGYGDTSLSRDKAKRLSAWMNLEKALESAELVAGTITGKVKGGLTVMINGIRAFLPGSLVDTRPVKDTTPFEGKTMDFKVIKLDRKRNNVVVSRRAVVEASMGEELAKLLDNLKEGAIVKGTVKNITDYGAFVDLGGIDGLLHITDISWGRVNHPSEHFAVGDEVEVVVLKFDPATERVSLGYKQKGEDPWTLVDKKYPIGSRVQGKVVSLVDYGAFVELEEGVEGLIHVSEMSWTKKVVNPSKILKVGDEVEAIVSELDMEQRRISLSLRQTERNPWEELRDSHPEGSIVEGKVRNLTEFGAFVEITEEIDGLIHVSDMSWTKRVKHPSEVLKKGDTVRARITNIDVPNQRVSLSIKEFLPNEWDDFVAEHRVGDTLMGKVVNITDFGLFIDIYKGLEGLSHISEIDFGTG